MKILNQIRKEMDRIKSMGEILELNKEKHGSNKKYE